MIEPVRAVVAPRVFIGSSDVALRLEDEIAERLDAGATGIIQLAGPAGCGKSAALSHLAFVLGDHRRLLLYADACPPKLAEWTQAAREKLVVVTLANAVQPMDSMERWRIAPWTQDTSIEYLLAAHHDRCASVMQRLLADSDRDAVDDRAELWRPILDALAADNLLPDTRAAVRAVVYSQLPTMQERRAAIEHCFALIRNPESVPILGGKATIWRIGVEALKLLRHGFPQLLLAAERLELAIKKNLSRDFLQRPLSIPLIQETARLIVDDESAFTQLKQIVTSQRRAGGQAMAASLLVAAQSGWSPTNGDKLVIPGAYLPAVQWRGLRMSELNAIGADLTSCNFDEADVDRLDVSEADLSGATVHRAKIRKLIAIGAQLVDADLSEIRVSTGQFCAANLQGANLEAAMLRRADLRAADLCKTNFRRADLRGADLIGSQLAGADFIGADLSYSDLSGVTLREAEFLGANLDGATLSKCDLEGMILPGARLKYADLDHAYLTGSRMPNARLRGANLVGAGLAEIDWEQADLRGADLRGCTFHLGSSRSGLVGSPLACEGSRTGFYTDELNEQDFKAPEEIRKANLRGSDLRGAKILNVDFYLVDVRDCLYTPKQEAHLRRTGAILETRV